MAYLAYLNSHSFSDLSQVTIKEKVLDIKDMLRDSNWTQYVIMHIALALVLWLVNYTN